MTKNSDIIPFTLLIAAAGSGARIGGDVPKQYMEIGGKAILRHTLDKFLEMDGLKEVRVIINPEHEGLYRKSVHGLNIGYFISGAKTRKDSIYNGLKALSNKKHKDIVLIHDAARPFFDAQDVRMLLETLQAYKAASLSCSNPNTLFDSSANGYVDRSNMRSILTPQGFHYGTIMAAHEKYLGSDDFTDDTALVKAMGEHVEFINSYAHNFKITTTDDLAMAEALLNNKRTTTRTGLGFDVHAFALEPSQNIRLGGIDIPHSKSLKGHSDADVVLHTITDALLGAVAAGDIGDHFPPSNNDFKNMDSAVFLKKAAEIVANKGGEIINIDVTIMCEAPKIGPHKERMQQRIAEILDVAVDKISIKATTTEKLGFTGRGEGIAAQAVVNVSAVE